MADTAKTSNVNEPKKPLGATIDFQAIETEFSKIPLAELKETEDFVHDRHWGEGGKYWIGWRPVPDKTGALSEAAQRQWQYVEKSFTQKNVIGSNLNRLEGAILGNEPDYDVVSAKTKPLDDPIAEAAREKTDDEKFFDEIDDKITVWWTQKGIHQIFKDFLRYRGSYGKTAILTYIPEGYLQKQEVGEGEEKKEVFALARRNGNLTFEDVLEKICVDVIHFEKVIDVKDELFGTKFSIVKLTDLGDKKRYGVFYVGTDGRSYLRIVSEDNSGSAVSCDLSGNNLCITVGEYTKALITPTVKKLQKSVNHAKTGENYALANINFPETTFINAEEFEEKDANGNPTGRMEAPKSGLGVTRFLKGLLSETINGTQFETPGVIYRDGADPEKFAKVADNNTRDIHQGMGMGYVFLADSEYASGDSKAKSMDDYDILILDYETTINTVGTQVLENVIRLAFNFTNQTARNKDFNVLFHVNVSTGKLTNDDKAGMREEVEMNLRSVENYMLTTKVSDNPINEQRRIAAQPPRPDQLPAKTGNDGG